MKVYQEDAASAGKVQQFAAREEKTIKADASGMIKMELPLDPYAVALVTFE